MIRIAVVEDDPGYRAQVAEFLKQYADETGIGIEKTEYADGSEIVKQYAENMDIILMDIEMPEMNGMSAAEWIRQQDRNVIIIFLTNSPQYAIRGYRVEALDYILKPISYVDFAQRLKRAVDRLDKRKNHYVTVTKGKSGVKRISVSEITYVEVREHSLIYHMESGTLTVTGTMRDVEMELTSLGFYRCNKCYLVNLAHVEAISGDDALVAGERLQISRGKKKGFMDALNNYFHEVEA